MFLRILLTVILLLSFVSVVRSENSEPIVTQVGRTKIINSGNTSVTKLGNTTIIDSGYNTQPIRLPKYGNWTITFPNGTQIHNNNGYYYPQPPHIAPVTSGVYINGHYYSTDTCGPNGCNW